MTAGLAEREIAEFVDDDEIIAQQILGEPPAAAGGFLLFELIDEIDQIEETSPGGRERPPKPRRCKDGFCPCLSRQRHGAGILAGEETIYYAFHPLAGKTVESSGRRVVAGGEELRPLSVHN